MLEAILLTIALGLAPYYTDQEDTAARSSRYRTVTTAIVRAARRATCDGQPEDCEPLWAGSSRDLSVLLLTQAYWESRLARHIHAGQCGPLECDPFRDVRTGEISHRATSLWQLQWNSDLPPREWRRLAGLDQAATDRAAWAAARALSRSKARCKTLAGAISGYATGGRCRWSGAAKRVAFFWRLRAKAITLSAPERVAKGR